MREWQATIECRTSLTVALGYRDLKPSLAGTCSLKGTDLEGRYERLLSDLRSRWTATLGTQAVQAIGVLQDRADRLEASLNREGGSGGDKPAFLRVDDLRRALAADEALVEFVSYAAGPSPPAGAAPRRYSAFILTSVGTLNWVDLGAAAPIDAAVADLLEAAHDWSVSVGGGERTAAEASTQTARTAIADLSARVWRPVKPFLDAQPNLRRLRIAPDASLNLVPFEALSDGHELIDRFAITYVPAGRDLIARSSPAPASAPVVVVSPGARPRGQAVQIRAASGQATNFRAEGLATLAAAAGEAADVRGIVSGTVVLTSSDATEQRVKHLPAPVILHVVGHGVVRETADCGGRPCATSTLDPRTRAMSLAAIVLEEAYGRGSGSADDGLLTALELQSMNLQGTEMLVLSQCQMASGAASVGEGVYGMRRAALIAGARTFVAPLWNVEDGVQRRLMKRFYDGLAAGESRADALRHAKLAVRRSAATNSFLYWAPVILSGASAPLPSSLFQHAR
jgi:CHAT domain-containing protein